MSNVERGPNDHTGANDTRPDRAAIEPRPATLWRRLGALLYDSLMLLAVLLGGAAAFHGFGAFFFDLKGAVSPASVLYHPFQIYIFLLIYAYHAWFWRRTGHTPGMATWNLRVRRNDGQPLTHGDCVRRMLGGTISIAAAGLGYVWILVDAKQHAWHDKWSGTHVQFEP
jgi:uncharacterized RDD family membrane protein YckC